MDKKSIRGKQKARKLLVQALYQWHMTHQNIDEIEGQFRMANKLERVDNDYFLRILYGVPKETPNLDAELTPFLDRPIKELNPIELTVLRLGAFELFFCLEIPYKVVLDEAISLTKAFGAQDGHKYVNGVLHKLAQKTRAIELEHAEKHG